MKVLAITSFIIVCAATNCMAQKADTILIDASKINTAVLKPGTNRYLVYFKNSKESARTKYQLWTRTISDTIYKKQKGIAVQQVWEDNDSIFHKALSVSEHNSFATLYHESWWRQRGTMKFDFTNKEARFLDTLITASDTAAFKKKMYAAYQDALGQYTLNWHLDLEVFSTLPFKANRVFRVNFYDPGFGKPQLQDYAVTGTAMLAGYDAQPVECWLLTHGDNNNREVFWISKKTKEVLKLEQEFNGRYRYKIKLPFSS